MIGDHPSSAIAVTGIACRFPGAPDIAAFWRNLCSGMSAIQRFERAELIDAGVSDGLLDRPGFVAACAPIPDPYSFDAAHFGVTPATSSLLDLQHRAFVECAWTALEASGTFAAGRSAAGVFAGCSDPTRAVETNGDDQSGALAASLGASSDFLAARAAFMLDLHGPAVTVRAACATSLLAVHLAVQSLLTHECDVALAGGVAIRHPLRRGHLHEPGGIYSEDGRCRPYDRLGSGIVSGDGVGAVVLRRLPDALACGEPIHAVILGSAVSNDGARKGSFTAPSVAGQVEAMLAALEVADVDPATIGFVEGHGTATPMGDPIEVEALKRAWRNGGKRLGHCWLGSVKSQIGHLDAASGIAGFIKACLCVDHGLIPGTLNFSEPNPHCALEDSPFRVSADLIEWSEARLRRASVNSLGLGGTNVHVVLQQMPPLPREPHGREADDPVVLTLSARRPEALPDYANALAAAIAAADIDVAAVARTLQHGRVAERYRAAVVGRDKAALSARLAALAAPVRPAATSPRVGLVFPGDGKRALGRVAQLAEHLPAIASTIVRAADHLRARWNVDLAAVIESGSSSTHGILAASVVEGVAVHAALSGFGVTGDIVLGQSLGELAAAVAAELIPLTDALDLAMARERTFRAVVPSGALAVLCAPEQLRERLPPEVEIALINSPCRCVVSAEHHALARFAAAMAEDDILTHPLELISAVHSSLLDPVLGEFRQAAARLLPRPPTRSFISSVEGGLVDHLTVADPDHWVRQLRETVHFDQCLRAASAEGNVVLVDMGLAGGLGGAIRETVGGTVQGVVRLAPVDETTSEIEAFGMALGALWECGVAIDWDGWPRRRFHQVALPVPPLARVTQPLEGADRGIRPSERKEADTVAIWQRSWRRMSPCSATVARQSVAVLARDETWGPALASMLVGAGHDVRSTASANELGDGDAIDIVVDARALDCGADFARAGELMELAKRLAGRRAEAPRLLVMMRGAFDVVGTETLSPGAAALACAALVTAQEHPELKLVAVDVEDEADIDRLAGFIASDADSGMMAAVRGQSIWRAVAERRGPLSSIAADRIGGPCVITGGLGRFGRWVGRWLAESGATDLFLLGRTAEPSPHAAEAITAMRRAGARVATIAVDMADPHRVRAVFDEMQANFAEGLTIFHLAGEPHAPSAYAPVDDLVRGGVQAALADQWAAKVCGAIALRDWTRDNRRSRCVVFSSNASILGGPGLAAYAAANAAVDCLATIARKREGLDWSAIGWDGWRLGDDAPGRQPSTLEAFALRGDEPFRALGAAMAVSGGHVMVAKGDFGERHRTWVETRGKTRPGATQHAAASPEPDDTAAPSGTLASIRSIWSKVLGPPLSDDSDLFEMGGDSLNAMRIRSQIERILGSRLTIQQVLRNATVAKLSDLVTLANTPSKDSDAPRIDADQSIARDVIRGRL